MPSPPIVAPKKLIEVALPLDEINKAAAKEKSIRHGHPSTLHLWWARRPLAAARAVIFAQLVNDPSWRYSEEELKKNQIKGSITKKRNELFKLITELVQWENTTNEDVLERARKEIRSSWKETCEANKNHPDAKTLFDSDRLPAFHDPFAGGGAIPLEAQRLGLEAYAGDLNPVAVLINKVMIEIPPKFVGLPPVGPVPKAQKQTSAKASDDWSGARGLAEDVRRYGVWMREEAERRIGHLYPRVDITKEMAKDRPDLKPMVGRKVTVVAWLWARTVKSPNPAFSDVETPLAANFVLSAKKGQEVYVEPVVRGRAYRFEVRAGEPPASAKDGMKAGSGALRCLFSGAPIPYEYVDAEANAGRMGQRLMAMVAEGDRKRLYLPPTALDEQVAISAVPSWKPETPCRGTFGSNAQGRRYGFHVFGDYFSSRQLVALSTFAGLLLDVRSLVRQAALDSEAFSGDDDKGIDAGGSGATAYADAVAVCLAFALSKLTDYATTLCRWFPERDSARSTFGRQGIQMCWDYTELNPLHDATGSFRNGCTWVAESLQQMGAAPLREPGRERRRPPAGHAFQENAMTQVGGKDRIVSTDPPYYDNIDYADLSDFFYVWLRTSLKPIFPDLFATLAVPKAEELVANKYRHGGKKEAEEFFLDGMTRSLRRLAVGGRSDYPTTIYYAFKQADTKNEVGTASTGWETFLQALIGAGFSLTGTWPMRTELANRLVGTGTNALASSVVLVCRRRQEDASAVARKDFLRQLERALPSALSEMTADPIAAIAPVDLAQAAIGPGMAIFSRFGAVLEADGSPMSVHNALVHINKAIDTFFAEGEGELDADTRFCIGWFQQHGFEAGPFGEADVLARAKGTAVDGVRDSGVLSSAKSKVRLFQVKDYPKNWDPAKDGRVPIWEACHQMCRALGESEHDAGALLARMPEQQDGIRHLAYRLYTICERQKWAEDARAYNDLITSWPAIVQESHKVGHTGTQLELA